MGIAAIVTDDDGVHWGNAYLPELRIIHLKHETHFKPDPVYWAIAAHELGHAHLHTRHPTISRLLLAGERAKATVGFTGLGLMTGNLLFALPGVTEAAFWLLTAALVLSASKLFDEAWASVWAYRELRHSAHLTPRHRRAVRAALSSSFLTYLGAVVGYAVLLTQWGLIERITSDGQLGEVATLGPLRLGIATLATAVGAFRLWRWVRRLLRSPPAKTMAGSLVSLAGFLLLEPAMIATSWNLHVDPIWAWAVILAFIPLGSWIVIIATAPLALPFWFLSKRIARLHARGVQRSAPYERALAAGQPLIHEGKQTIARLRAEASGRQIELRQWLFVPLLVVFWIRFCQG